MIITKDNLILKFTELLASQLKPLIFVCDEMHKGRCPEMGHCLLVFVTGFSGPKLSTYAVVLLINAHLRK